MCRILCALYHLVFTTIWNAYYHLPDFIDDETRLGEVKLHAQDCADNKL